MWRGSTNLEGLQGICMELEVLLDEGGNVVVAVVILRTQAIVELQLRILHLAEIFGQELLFLEEFVAVSLVEEDRPLRSVVLLGEFGGIVLRPCSLVGAQVAGEGLLSPRTLRRVADGRECRDGLEILRIRQADCERA